MTKVALVPFQAPALATSGLTGATSATRYVGGTTSGAPGSGTFSTGDFVIAQNGHVFVCTAGGTPGTWTDAGAGGVPATFKEQAFTSSGTFNVPANVSEIYVTVVGAGGGGSGATNNAQIGGFGAGGGGGQVIQRWMSVTPGGTVTATIGTGGAGGTGSTGTPGSTGGSTTFGSITALGGVGGDGHNTRTGGAATAGGHGGGAVNGGSAGSGVAGGGAGAGGPGGATGPPGGVGTTSALPGPSVSIIGANFSTVGTTALVGAGCYGGGGGSSAYPTHAMNGGTGIDGRGGGGGAGAAPGSGGVVYGIGIDGGGNGASAGGTSGGNGSNGTANTGGGGGGGSSGSSTGGNGGNGADGTVVVEWVEGTTGTTASPASTIQSETSFGVSSTVGASTNYAREDHTHGSPSGGTMSALLTLNAGLTIPSGQALATGTRSVVTGTRSTTTIVSDTVDLGTFSTTGGAVELRIHAHLAAPAAGTTASVTKVYELAMGALMGTASTWYLCLPADASANAATTNDFALEVNRTAAGVFSFRFRQKTIGVAGVITFTVETLGDTTVSYTASSSVTTAPTAVSTTHPSNVFVAAAGNIGIGTESPTVAMHVVGTMNATSQVQENGARVYSANNTPPYPVTSVASRTGAISLTAADVSAGTFPGGTFNIGTLNATTDLQISGSSVGRGLVTEAHLSGNSSNNVASTTLTTVAGTIVTNNGSGSSGNLQASFTGVTGRTYHVIICAGLLSTTAGDTAGMTITKSGTSTTAFGALTDNIDCHTSNTSYGLVQSFVVYCTAGGTVVLAVQFKRASGTGTVSMADGSSIKVLDV